MNFFGVFPSWDERNRDAGSFLPYSIVLSAFGYEMYSYSYYSPTPPKKKRKSRSLGKERSLSVRRTRIAKDGHKEALLEVKEEQALGKASTSATLLGHDCHHNAIHPPCATGVRIHY